MGNVQIKSVNQMTEYSLAINFSVGYVDKSISKILLSHGPPIWGRAVMQTVLQNILGCYPPEALEEVSEFIATLYATWGLDASSLKTDVVEAKMEVMDADMFPHMALGIAINVLETASKALQMVAPETKIMAVILNKGFSGDKPSEVFLETYTGPLWGLGDDLRDRLINIYVTWGLEHPWATT